MADDYPLHSAIREGRLEDIRALIASGSDVNQRDAMSRTPLHIAAWKGDSEAMQVLIRAKAQCNARAKDEFTALHFAALTGDARCIELVTKADKSLVHGRISKGKKTALHLAVSKGHVDAVRALLQAGANTTATTGKGETAADIAQQHTKGDDNFASILQLINEYNDTTEIKHGTKTSVENIKKRSLVDDAVQEEEKPTAETSKHPEVTATIDTHVVLHKPNAISSEEAASEIVVPRKNKKAKRNIVISHLTSMASDTEDN